MLPQFKEFQVNAYTKRELKLFLESVNAQYQCIEDWRGAYTEPGMDVVGWGITDMPIKHLNRLADLMGVALIGSYPVENITLQKPLLH